MDEYPVRKHPRLKGWDYSAAGAYFLTLCTNGRRPILSTVVGRGILDAPQVHLTQNGRIVAETIQYVKEHRKDLSIDTYVVMPNHVHILVTVLSEHDGASGMPRPTEQKIPALISTIKRFSNRQSGQKLWQSSYHDHIVRDETDYWRIAEYIENNPAKWLDDRYYIRQITE